MSVRPLELSAPALGSRANAHLYEQSLVGSRKFTNMSR